jgi:Tol biopolymer transport system component
MVGERTPQVLPTTPLRGGVHAAFSPDGRWVAFHAAATAGRLEVWLRRFVPPGTEDAAVSGQWRASTDGGIFPAWSVDSRELFYLNPEGALMAVAVDASGDTPTLGDPQRLFDTGIVGGGIDRAQSRQYDVSSDGRFIINTSLESEVAPITLLQNFDPAASR